MQRELRDRLHKFLASEGTTQKFVANKVCIDTSILSRFKNGKMNLESVDEKLLSDFLTKKGY
jgi:hypothetical protein